MRDLLLAPALVFILANIGQTIQTYKTLGDMRFTNHAWESKYGNRLQHEQMNKKPPSDKTKTWPQQTVNYFMSENFTEEQKTFIRSTLNFIQSRSCITFKEENATNMVAFIFNPNGCYSFIGYIGGTQTIELSTDCMKYKALYDLVFHTLGFWHENNRHDRDYHVKINWNNIKEGKKADFTKSIPITYREKTTPYDLFSIMHFDSKQFSKNSKDTIRSNNRIGSLQDEMGRSRYFMSFFDWQALHYMYCEDLTTKNCGTKTSRSCPGQAFRDSKNCLCMCHGGTGKNSYAVPCKNIDKENNWKLICPQDFLGGIFIINNFPYVLFPREGNHNEAKQFCERQSGSLADLSAARVLKKMVTECQPERKSLRLWSSGDPVMNKKGSKLCKGVKLIYNSPSYKQINREFPCNDNKVKGFLCKFNGYIPSSICPGQSQRNTFLHGTDTYKVIQTAANCAQAMKECNNLGSVLMSELQGYVAVGGHTRLYDWATQFTSFCRPRGHKVVELLVQRSDNPQTCAIVKLSYDERQDVTSATLETDHYLSSLNREFVCLKKKESTPSSTAKPKKTNEHMWPSSWRNSGLKLPYQIPP